MSLRTQTIRQLLDALERGTCSSADIVEDVLAAAGSDELNAYTQFSDETAETARAAATAADEQRAAGAAADKPLLGIPVGVKDLLAVRGQETRCGSKLLRGFTSPYNATAVQRLLDDGAIPLGRMNMDEFAMGSSNENSADGPCRNPHDPDRVPGGSSGGSAAAVAGNLAIATLGSDTGGSIRQPASFCGCVGLKPTYGRVSRYGLTAYASSLDQIGPLTKTVDDAALVLQSIAGHDPLDSTSLPEPVPDYASSVGGKFLEGLTLGIPKEYFAEGLHREVEGAVRRAIVTCQEAGATIREVSLPHTAAAIAAYYIIATAEASANLARFDGIRYGARAEGKFDNPIDLVCETRAAGFGAEVKRRIILGTYVLSSGYYDAYYTKAQQARALIRRDFDTAFESCDALLGPVAPTPAYLIGDCVDDPLQMYLGDIYTVPVNLAGICGLSVPCGQSEMGLPIGLQIVGPAFGEPALLRVGAVVEAAHS